MDAFRALFYVASLSSQELTDGGLPAGKTCPMPFAFERTLVKNNDAADYD